MNENEFKKQNRTTAIVLAAGSGKRMHSDVAKQFIELLGKPIICYCLDTFEKSDYIDEIILVTNTDGLGVCKDITEKYGYKKVSAIVLGGKERYHSVWSGLQAAKYEADSTNENPPKYIFIHDGARPFVDEGILKRNAEALHNGRACVTGMPSKDTVKIAGEDGFVCDTPKRSNVWIIQTPQSFDFSVIYESYRKLIETEAEVLAKGIQVTDDAMVVEHFGEEPVRLVEGTYENIKITTPEDLDIAEILLKKGNRI